MISITKIEQLIIKGEEVLKNREPDYPHVFAPSTVDNQLFISWQSQTLQYLQSKLPNDSVYFQSFKKKVQKNYPDQVEDGIGILKSIKEDINEGLLNSNKQGIKNKKGFHLIITIFKQHPVKIILFIILLILIFSGIRPTEINIFGIKFPLELHKLKLQSLSSKNDKKQITPTPLIKNNFSIKPVDIQNQIESLPILQQENAGDNYKGIKVNWQVFLSGTYRIDNNQYILLRYFNDEFNGILIQCIINIDKYPELKIINKNQQFNVKGSIKSATTSNIDLNDCELNFTSN